MFSLLVTPAEGLVKWRYGSLFRTLGFVASNKSVGNKARLLPRRLAIVARVGSRMPVGSWQSWTRNQIFIFANCKQQRWKNSVGKFRM